MKSLKSTKIVALFLSVFTVFFSFFQWNEPVSYQHKTYDNVIIMIGDGMGENHLKATKKAYKIKTLNMETAALRAQSMTDNVWGTTTDSAAGGTALACGIRTINGYVGSYFYDPLHFFASPLNLSEAAISLGKSAGVVTTDRTCGATPSSFSAHVKSRNDTEDITKQQLKSNLTLIWGGESEYLVDDNMAKENGFTLITNKKQLTSLKSGTKSFGQFNFDDLYNVTNTDVTPTLDILTEKAIDILDDNQKGFSLMVEGACIDKNSHSNNMDGMTKCLIEFDKAVKVALDYAKKDGSTLVVITADHETGGITYYADTDSYGFTKTGHTDANVPLFVNDVNAGFTNNVPVRNRQVGAQLGLDLGMKKGSYPADNDFNLLSEFFKSIFKK